ncbi:MAG: glycoside hydrolase family 16 protein [Ruminococcus sp.]|nr:glycoside hydrolase family 16 protein [Ruminococcus sp.]
MRKKIAAFLMSVLTAVSTAAGKNVESDNDLKNEITVDGKDYIIVFEDDFDGGELDGSKWKRCPEQKRQDRNNYWRDEMSYLDGKGNLVIGMKYDKYRGEYMSGGVRTKGLFEQAYGYFEIRCTVNTVPGYWTAFWLMNDCVVSEENGGVDGTEIDIFESPFCGEGKIQHTLNWDGYGKAHKALGKITDADVYDGEYHTFGLLWTEEEYVFYIDGKETWRTCAEEAEGVCGEPLYIKISSETGSWTGLADPKTLPDEMMVDYVRVYKRR